MPTRTAYPARPRRGPLRSPLAAAPHSPSAAIRPGAALTGLRHMPRYRIRARHSGRVRRVPAHRQQQGRPPYEEATIHAYVYPPSTGRVDDRQRPRRRLHHRRHRDAQPVLPRVLPALPGRHAHQQRNLIQLFNYLQREYGHPSPTRRGSTDTPKSGTAKTLSPASSTTCWRSRRRKAATSRRPRPRHHPHPAQRGHPRQELLGMVMHTFLPICSEIPSSASSRSKAPERREGRLVSLAPATPGRWPFIYVRAAITSSPTPNGCGSGPGTARASGTPGSARCSSARRRSRVRPGDPAPVPPHL